MTLNLTIPTKWNDLSRKQLLYIARLFILKLSQNAFRMRAFTFLTKSRVLGERKVSGDWFYIFRHGRQRFMIQDQELLFFLKSVDFLTQDSRLTVNRFPVIRIWWKRFFGPSNSGYNISWLEFINAESCFYAFNTSHDPKYLRQLCAILYRPQKKNYRPMAEDYNGDRRQRFNDFTYQRRARWFRWLSSEKLMCIYVFYAGFRNKLVDENRHCFSGGAVSSEPVNPVKDLMATMRMLNLDDITKNETIQRSMVWEAFAQLNDMIGKSKEQNKNGKI
jgi:hypothetical protein